MTGWFSSSGVAQMVVLVLFEAAYFALHIFRQPYASRHVNFQQILFGAFRLVITLLNITYVDTLNILDRNKQAVAYTQVTLHCIVFLLMFAFPIRNLVVLLTGLADDEIYEAGAPPARMAIWRRKRTFGRREMHQRVPANDE
ncbi:hypothetical protein BDB00DRAFT_740203, partial [Zychaea mexicana]|uniref:uncharacterized protein n=1 Tax=Zychaea mexicana TaxID=64656 RepID=UPI0022FE6D66